MTLKRIVFLLPLLPFLSDCTASAQLHDVDVEVIFNFRQGPTTTLNATIGNGVEFERISVLQGFLDIDFDETGVTFVNYPGSIRHGHDQNIDDFFSFEFSNLKGSIVAFEPESISWESFPELSFSDSSIQLQHSDRWHIWPRDELNRYAIAVASTSVPEPNCNLAVLIATLVGSFVRDKRSVSFSREE